ncbi:hypothetical protein HanHA89_Chr14g0567791 [Helianthus annuus]|nr:hypothetical protein HanHA89_Chr14g0567791 [Helianthus annuus]
MDEFMSVRQESAVDEYWDVFRFLLRRVKLFEEISEDYATYIFIFGLKPETGDVLMGYHNLDKGLNLEQAFSLARMRETILGWNSTDTNQNQITRTELESNFEMVTKYKEVKGSEDVMKNLWHFVKNNGEVNRGALIKTMETWMLGIDLLIIKTFEWKLGWRCSVEKLRENDEKLYGNTNYIGSNSAIDEGLRASSVKNSSGPTILFFKESARSVENCLELGHFMLQKGHCYFLMLCYSGCDTSRCYPSQQRSLTKMISDVQFKNAVVSGRIVIVAAQRFYVQLHEKSLEWKTLDIDKASFDDFCRILVFLYTVLVQSIGHKVPAKWIKELIKSTFEQEKDIGNKVQQQCEIATNMHVINLRSDLAATWATIEQVMAIFSECGDDKALLQVNLTRVATTIVKVGIFFMSFALLLCCKDCVYA